MAHHSTAGQRPFGARSATTTWNRSDIAEMLANTIGLDKSIEVVESAAAEMGSPHVDLNRHEAQLLLSKIAELPGLVGMTASLAKSRLHFSQAANSLKSIG